MLFLDKIIVYCIIQVYISLCRPFATTYQSWYLNNVTVAFLINIHIMIIVLWYIYHHGCIDGILKSINIALIIDAIINVTIFYSVPIIWSLSSLSSKTKLPFRGTNYFGAYSFNSLQQIIVFICGGMVITLHFET